MPKFHPDDWQGDTIEETAMAYARAVAPTVGERSPGAIAWAAAQSWARFERTSSDLIYLDLRDVPPRAE